MKDDATERLIACAQAAFLKAFRDKDPDELFAVHTILTTPHQNPAPQAASLLKALANQNIRAA